MIFDPIILSRIQFALTLSFHILFPTLTIGLALYLLGWEIAWLRTRNKNYYYLARFWSKIFALAFGMGVVSGIVLSYEFGTNFSKFSQLAGNIVGPLMSYEVLSAFFLEAGFLGIMLFGWNRVSSSVHLFATLMVAVGTLLSAFWILSANSWMQTPTGYRLENGVFYVDNWLQVIFNPSFPYRFSHMVVASLLTTSFFLAGSSAWYLLKQRYQASARKVFSATMAAALVLAPAQLVLGDLHGLNTLHYQPIKISAIEGRWETMRSAPLTLFALPNMAHETNDYAVDIPKLGSLILTHDINGEVLGLKTVSKEDRPYVPILFYSFRIMVGIGLLFIFMAFVGLYLRLRKRLYDTKWFLKWCVYIAPLGFVAVIAGWFTTETGRQPWVVYGLLRTKEAASILPAAAVLTSLSAFLILYGVLLTTFIFYLIRLLRKGLLPMKLADEKPDNLTAWIEKKDKT